MKLRKKPVIVDAFQWYEVDAFQWFEVCPYVEGEKRIVNYFRHPNIPGNSVCPHCDRMYHDHGFIDTLAGGHAVCPGDWIITGVLGEHYPCKPDIFQKTYEPVEASYEK